MKHKKKPFCRTLGENKSTSILTEEVELEETVDKKTNEDASPTRVEYPGESSPKLADSVKLLNHLVSQQEKKLQRIIKMADECQDDERPQIKVMCDPEKCGIHTALVDAARFFQICLECDYILRSFTDQDDFRCWDAIVEEFHLPICGFSYDLVN